MREKALNKKTEFITRANALYNPLLPKAGVLFIGNEGVEYRSKSGQGFIQIPWNEIVQVRVQLFFKGWYVRGFYIESKDGQLFEFVVSDAKTSLKYMRKHLERECFVANPSNFTNLFKRKKE